MKPACICALSIAMFLSLPAVAQHDRPSPWGSTDTGTSTSTDTGGNGPSPFKVAPSGDTPPYGGTTPPIGSNPPFGGTTPPLGGDPPSGGTAPPWRSPFGNTAPAIDTLPFNGGTTPPSGGTTPENDHSWYNENLRGKVEPGTGRIYGPEPGTFIDPPKRQTPETSTETNSSPSNSSPLDFSFDSIVNYAIIAIGLIVGIRYITKKKAPQTTEAPKETT